MTLGKMCISHIVSEEEQMITHRVQINEAASRFLAKFSSEYRQVVANNDIIMIRNNDEKETEFMFMLEELRYTTKRTKKQQSSRQ